MFLTQNNVWKEDGARTVELKCSNCGNTAENYVVGAFDGLNIGMIFIPKKYHVGKKAYFLICPICENANKELSLSEVDSLKG